MTKVVRHYIAESAPRQLDLFAQERNACFHSTQHTTHPSALLPAFLAAESAVKTQSHPNFARWAVRNANRPRLTFMQLTATAAIFLGLLLGLLLILSRASHFVRIVCLALWWPGFTTLLAAWQGICLVLYCRSRRELRPWEPFTDLDPVPADKIRMARIANTEDLERGRTSFDSSRRGTLSRIDPLRKGSLQAFGPSNSFDGEPWVDEYARKPLHRKIFEETLPTKNQNLTVLHDRIVFRAFLWAGLVSTALTVLIILVPNGNVY